MQLALVSVLLCSLSAVCFGHSAAHNLNGKAVSEKDTVLWGSTVQKDFMKSVKKWYIPVWSKFYKYRTASEILAKEIEELTPNDLGTNSCLSFEPPNSITGFEHKATFDINGTATSFIFKAPYEKAHAAEMKFELTDNAKFILGVATWEDGEKAWAVLSTTPKLEVIEYAKVLGRVKSLGFNFMNTVFEDFSSCENH